jgi:hypothetical protein
MRRQDKLKVIMEANQRLEESYLNGKGLINEAYAWSEQYFPELKGTINVSDNMVPNEYPKKGDKVNLNDGKTGDVEAIFKNESNNQVLYGLVMYADGGGKFRKLVPLSDIKK